MDIGDDLSINMLSDSQGGSDDFVLDVEGGIPPAEEEKKEKKDNISDEGKPQESVAEKKGEETPGVSKTSSPTATDKIAEIYSSLATHFHEAGVLPSLNLEESKITTKEGLEEAIKAEITNGLEESVKQYKQAMEAGEPQDAYVNYTRQKEQLFKITDDVLTHEDSGELRFKIIAQDFINRGFDKDEAMKFAKRSQDLGEDTTDAAKSLERIKQFNEDEYRAAVTAKDTKEKENIKNIERFIETTDEIIKGIKLTKATKDNLITQMSTATSRDENGNPLSAYGEALIKDPVATKVITEYLFMISKGFKDFSKINTLLESSTTSKIDEVLRNSGGAFLSGGSAAAAEDNQQTFSWGEDLDFDV